MMKLMQVGAASSRFFITKKLPLSRNVIPSSFSFRDSDDSSQRLTQGCPMCQITQMQSFHASCRLEAGKIRNTKRKLMKPVVFKPKSHKTTWDVVEIRENLTVLELANLLQKDVDHVFDVLFRIPNTDKYESESSVIDRLDIVKSVVDKSGFRWKMGEKKKMVEKINKDVQRRPPPEPADLVKRPPVVTIMGHVDHGKTTLLDALRDTDVVAGEFGGITQHIGAFSVELRSGELITFLDTPGHAAFSAMRARGANVTDIVVLVVAAEDGVMRQTQESIKFAQQANVPIIVAVNKIDKYEADVERTKKMLLEQGLHLEDYGGDVQVVPISALKKTNLDQLQEAIVALSEMQEVSADPTGLVEAAVIESRVDPGRGKLSTALIQRGTLKRGACLVAGTSWAKVRGMFNDKGRPVTEVLPGIPVEIIGWRELPSAGDEIIQVDSEQKAKEVIGWRQEMQRAEWSETSLAMAEEKAREHRLDYEQQRAKRLEMGYRRGAMYRHQRTKETIISYDGPELTIVIKGDVDGSVEAILDTLESYRSDQCKLHILQYGVGAVAEQDVEMAANFGGIIYGFNVTCQESVAKVARSKGVDVRLHNIIYKMMDDLKEELTRKLAPVDVEEIKGEANVQQLFMVTEGKKKVPVAGSRCVSGILQRKHQFRLERDGEILIEGPVTSLKHFKSEAESVKMGTECGICFADKTVVPQPGDRIICYSIEPMKQTLDWQLDF